MTYEELRAFGEKIAALLPDGWTLQPDDRKRNNREEIYFAKGEGAYTLGWWWDGLRFAIYANNHEKRLKIGHDGWPTYTELDRGEPQTKRVWPGDLYDPREEYPSITVAFAKSPEAVAKDILRRFLPEYERIFARCRDAAMERQKYHNAKDAGWATICRAVNRDPKRSQHYDIADGTGAYVSLEGHNSNPKMTIEAPAEKLIKILELLREQSKSEERNDR
jgi:hypothetical protein